MKLISTPSLPLMVGIGLGGAVLGSLGSLLVRMVIPEPAPGDGFTVRWLTPDATSVVNLNYGPDEVGALHKALEISKRFPKADVTMVDIRQGRVHSIQRAGERMVTA